MRVIDFLRRVVAAGGDATKIRYTITDRSGDPLGGVRTILYFDGNSLQAHDSIRNASFQASYAFVFKNSYKVSMVGLVGEEDGRRKSLMELRDSPVLVNFAYNP